MSETDNNYYIAEGQGSYNFLVSNGKILRPTIAAFAVYCENDESLTFYSDTFYPTVGREYNEKIVSNIYNVFDAVYDASYSDIPWSDIRTQITNVSFDVSFKDVSPISTAYWFYNFTKCESIDLNNLNTEKVTNMCYMFYGCQLIENLDVSQFITSNVSSMYGMFYGCSKITEIDVSRFNTSNVTSMTSMFCKCSNLKSIDVSNFDTRNVIMMNYMFEECTSLTHLDLSNFDTHNLTGISQMFWGDIILETIFADDEKFVTSNIDTSRNDLYARVFSNCESLVGGNGTVYRSNHIDYTYAHVDVPDNPGYFTDASERDVFAMYSEDDNSLTFYHYKLPEVGDTCYGKTVTKIFTGFETEAWESASEMQWYSIRGSIEKVIVAGSFKDVQPISLAYWFYDMENAAFRGLENIDTSHATSFKYAFYNCNGLTNGNDISAWDTSNVTSFYGLFWRCSNLLNIDGLEQWDVSHVTDFGDIFSSCHSLINADSVSKWDISKATYLDGFFDSCTNLISADISNWKTANVINMERMFYGCSSLVTIYSNDNNFVVSSLEIDGDRRMFYNCYNLVGGNGTVYNSSKITSEMAHIDTESNPGYFTKK